MPEKVLNFDEMRSAVEAIASPTPRCRIMRDEVIRSLTEIEAEYQELLALRNALSAETIMDEAAFGAWWAVGEAAASAAFWNNVVEDMQLTVLIRILYKVSRAISEKTYEDSKDAQAAYSPGEDENA